jgi:hypothetical protein
LEVLEASNVAAAVAAATGASVRPQNLDVPEGREPLIGSIQAPENSTNHNTEVR